jgi:hypothetical protein
MALSVLMGIPASFAHGKNIDEIVILNNVFKQQVPFLVVVFELHLLETFPLATHHKRYQAQVFITIHRKINMNSKTGREKKKKWKTILLSPLSVKAGET